MSVITKDTIQPASGQALTIKDEGGTASITVATNGEATFAENIKITANKGINFSAYATSGNPSSNLLDDYEEGSISSVTISGSTSGSGSVICTGSYTKVGRLVTLTVNIGNRTFPTFSGTLRCSLPFTVGSVLAVGQDTYYYPQGSWDQQTNWVGFKPQAVENTTYCIFPDILLESDRQTALSSSNTNLSGTANLYLAFSLTYQSA